jgi:PDDEXK-like domain of unknown function (DUF3799)
VTTTETTTDGVVRGLPHDAYLAHPALSASGAKILAQPGGPARYRWALDHPEPPRDAYELGTAAHTAILGTGPGLLVVDLPDWRSKAAQAAKQDARAAGLIPLLTADAARVDRMAAAVRAHPIAAALLEPGSGEAEVSLFWTDPEHGVDRRCRVDWLREPDDRGRLILVDLKTATSAAPWEFGKAAARYGYAQQAAWYADLTVALGLAAEAPFVFVVVEKDPPHLVSVIELDAPALDAGRALNRKAMRLFRECTDTGTWPGYSPDVQLVGLPSWALYEAQETGE